MMASSFSAFETITPPPVPTSEDFHSNTSDTLHGIKLHGASFSPSFPAIEPQDVVFSDTSDAVDNSILNRGNKENVANESIVWKDFTAIIETKTPKNVTAFQFSNNFSSNFTSSLLFSIKSNFEEDILKTDSKSRRSHSKPISFPSSTPQNLDLYDSNHKKSVSAAVSDLTQNCSQGASIDSVSEATLRTPESVTMATPESVSVDTPNRLFDLQVLRARLTSLKTLFTSK